MHSVVHKKHTNSTTDKKFSKDTNKENESMGNDWIERNWIEFVDTKRL